MHTSPSEAAADALLRLDPARAYAEMDAPTRERYLRAVRHLAAHARAAPGEEGVVRAALRRAEEATADPESRPAAAHVGYHLVGPGAAALEREVGYHPPARVRAYRFLWRHATPAYLGLASVLALALLVPALAYAARHGAGAGMLALAAAAVLPVAADAAVTLARGILHARFPLRVLPRMAFAEGIPDEHRTLVVVPTLLRSPEDVRRQMADLARMAEDQPGPNLRFALLSDFTDAPQQHMPGDREILAEARREVRRLNARLHTPVGDRFFVLHRERAWNPDEARWTGWLRKSGKLEELLRLLREPGARFGPEPGFRWIFGNLQRAGVPFRYVITVDETDRLEPGCAADLVRTAAHPLNRPWVDRRLGRVTEGYGMLQPAERTAPGVRSPYADLVHGRPAPDAPAHRAAYRPHFYTDVFGAGQFHGKGLLDVDAWRAVLPGVITPAAVLSHDVLESFYARAANVGDLRMTEGPMDRYLVQARVDQRWMRGDCQLAPWLLPWVRGRWGRAARNPLPWTLRLRVLRLMLAAVVRPATLAVLLLGWTVLPAPALLWTGVALAPALLQIAAGAAARRGGWRAQGDAALHQAFRVGVLAHRAVLAGDAAARGVWRALVSRKLRTRWLTQRQSAQQPLTPAHYGRAMWASPAVGAGALAAVAAVAPDRLPVAAPFALAWIAAPLWVRRLDRPLAPAAAPRPRGEAAATQPAA